MKEWTDCKNILLIRLDNMGDVIMSNPAFIQVRLNFPKAKLTLLTSSAALPIIPYLGSIDNTILFDPPWMKKSDSTDDNSKSVEEIVEELKTWSFDACIVFSVYSQNILPTALICFMANIPIRAAYCRENPYHLLTHWVPDPEPLEVVHHQITRDLLLLKKLNFPYKKHNHPNLISPVRKLTKITKYTIPDNYILLNLDASEEKRQLPFETAITLVKILKEYNLPIVMVGKQKTPYLRKIQSLVSLDSVIDIVGKTSIVDLLHLTKQAKAVISVNTGLVHIACAYEIPLLVLYANTNPQHIPWSANSIYYAFDIEDEQKSKNGIIRYVDENHQLLATKFDSTQINIMIQELLKI